MTKHQIDFSALQKPHWNADQTAKAKLVIKFIQGMMNDHNFDYIRSEFGGHSYVQHNRNLPDGISGVVGYLEKFVKSFPDYQYDVKNVIVDGDYVSIHSHVTIKKGHRGNDRKGLNITDTWRMEDGRLVEHWDSVQPIDLFMRVYTTLAGGRILNRNGVF